MPVPNKPSLDTLGEIFRFAVRRFRAARLAYGHGTTNAHDEAAFLVLEGLGLPIDRLEPYLDLRPTPEECGRLMTLIDARPTCTASASSPTAAR
jgi:ribosomal protein L3 glutamine methyltransferase